MDLDIIEFDFGSAELSAAAIEKLEDLADAILEVIEQDPTQVFLIAGHTDAVGSFEKNLELSEERAANVQEVLISEYGVPAENLEAVGYGEQYLLINTSRPERRNRRVVVRSIGSLLADRPVQRCQLTELLKKGNDSVPRACLEDGHRHTIKDLMREAGIDRSVQDAISGHEAVQSGLQK